MLIDDIEYVIFRHPDLGAARQFVLDFGLLDLEQTTDRIYMRCYGDAPFSYVTSKGDAAFVGMGFRVASREALDRLSARFDSGVTECPHPGGGVYVVGNDPDGRRLEFVFGEALGAGSLRGRANQVERLTCEGSPGQVPASGLWPVARPAAWPCRPAHTSTSADDRLVLRDLGHEAFRADLQGR